MKNETANTAENKPTESNRILEVLKISFPIVTAVITAVVTGIVGYIIWNAQNRIQQQVENNNLLLKSQLEAEQAQLQAQLTLKEEFYKRCLSIYEEACRQIADTQTALANVGTDDESVMRATNLVDKLDRFRRRNQLYWSEQLDEHLDNLWNLGICRAGSRPCEGAGGEIKAEDVPKEIASAVLLSHNQMKTDLNIFELAKALQEVKASQETK